MTTPLSDERIAELTYRLKGPVTNPLDWWCEADDLFTIGNELLVEVTRLRARNAELVAVLRGLEWAGGTEDGDAHWCLVCGEYDHENHSTDCALDAALNSDAAISDAAVTTTP